MSSLAKGAHVSHTSCEGTNPGMGLYPHNLITLWRPHLLTPSHWGLGVNNTNLGRHYIQPIACTIINVIMKKIEKLNPRTLLYVTIYEITLSWIVYLLIECSITLHFFLWELKSEAQTLNHIIFLYPFFFFSLLAHLPATKTLLV